MRDETTYRTILHRDGTVTYWSVYCQQWVRRVSRVPDKDLAAMSRRERHRVLCHIMDAGTPEVMR